MYKTLRHLVFHNNEEEGDLFLCVESRAKHPIMFKLLLTFKCIQMPDQFICMQGQH